MRRALIQVSIVLVLVAASSYFAIHADFNSKLNLVWLFGLPTVVAIVANRLLIHRIAMAVTLIASSIAAFLMTMAATGAA